MSPTRMCRTIRGGQHEGQVLEQSRLALLRVYFFCFEFHVPRHEPGFALLENIYSFTIFFV